MINKTRVNCKSKTINLQFNQKMKAICKLASSQKSKVVAMSKTNRQIIN